MKTLKYKNIPEQYVRTKSDRNFIDAGGTFQIDKGQRVQKFCETYMTPTRGFGAGRTVKLADWQRDSLIYPLFSWIKPNGYRRFNRGCLFIPRQNGKSFISSALALYMLCADDEPGAYVVTSAVSGRQTKVIYDEIANSISHNKGLKTALHVKESTREIVYPARGGKLLGASADNFSLLGSPPSFYCADEFAFWDNFDPWTSITTGSGSRRQPLYFAISTSGNRRDTPAYEMFKYGQAVNSSLVDDPGFFGLVYAAGKDDDIHAESTWRKCNPSLGQFLDLEDVRNWSERAKHSKIEELNFRQFRLNEWCSSVNQFLNLDAWARCVPDKWSNLDGKEAYLGIDLASTQDLTSCVCIIPHEGKYYVEHHSFCCIDTVRKREAANATRYSLFEQEGTLSVHQGNCIDLDAVRDYVRSLTRKYRVRAIGIDAAHNAADTMIILQNEGLPVVPFSCNPVAVNLPMRRLNDLVLSGKLQHKGDSLINWQAQNLESKASSRDLIMWAKPNQDSKIDTMAALVIALSQTITTEAQESNRGPIKFELW